MLKKSLSLVLVVLMAFSLVMTASAADSADALTENEALAAAEAGVAALVAEDGDDVTLDEDLAEEITDGADTPEEISRVIGRFVFIEEGKVEELSDAIIAVSADKRKSSHAAFNPDIIQTPRDVIKSKAKKRFFPFIIVLMISFV